MVDDIVPVADPGLEQPSVSDLPDIVPLVLADTQVLRAPSANIQ